VTASAFADFAVRRIFAPETGAPAALCKTPRHTASAGCRDHTAAAKTKNIASVKPESPGDFFFDFERLGRGLTSFFKELCLHRLMCAMPEEVSWKWVAEPRFSGLYLFVLQQSEFAALVGSRQ
jgi:hypothetical protein